MAPRSRKLNFNDMISWLREDLQSEGYRVFDTCEKIPRLPIDLFCVKENGDGIKYLIIIVASIDEIDEGFQKKLLFYQYFVSSHYDPMQYALVLAIPATAKVNTTSFLAEDPEDKKRDFYKQQGFGLWKIRNRTSINKTTYPAIPLRQKIKNDLEKNIVKNNLKIKKMSPQILRFIDNCIHDSVKGITEFNLPKFNERYIDYKLLEKGLEINQVNYCNCLCDGIEYYLSRKDDDFEFSTNLIKSLWKIHVPSVPYPEIHRKLDSLLKEINPRYREHYIHQFQVFLFGVLILDILRNNQKLSNNFGNLCFLFSFVVYKIRFCSLC